MSNQAVEIAYLPLKPNLDISTGEAATAWSSTLDTISSQPGSQSLYWGRQIEHPDTITLIIYWETLASHETFTLSPSYPSFLSTLNEHILASPPEIFHITVPSFTPAIIEATHPLQAPVTECISLYFPPTQSSEGYAAQFAQGRDKALESESCEVIDMMGGWAVEERWHESLVAESGDGDGDGGGDQQKGDRESKGKGKMFAALNGWPSIESHLAFRKTEEFPDVVKLLRGEAKGIVMWHVGFQRYK